MSTTDIPVCLSCSRTAEVISVLSRQTTRFKMIQNSPLQKEYLKARLAKDQLLLNTINGRLPELEALLVPLQMMYEDGIYRFYHHSFKVYQLQDYTLKIVEIFKDIAEATDNQLCEWFEQIVAAGTGVTWEPDHNKNWTLHARPIIEAFLHAKYFLAMMIKYGRELETAPTKLPTGWAAILELYNQR